MKTKFIAVLVLLTVFISGCKDEKSVDNLEVVKPEVIDNSFKVTLDVIVKEDDDFSLFYTEDGSTDFKTEPLWVSIKGSTSSQKVVFSLPEEVYPTQLRLDFGINNNQKDIIFQNITMEHKGKSKTISGADLGNYFRADDSKCSFDAKTGTIKAIVDNGKRKYASLYPHEANLGPFLVKLVK